MDSGIFQFEDCPLKHYVRKKAWLARCKERLKTLRATASTEKDARRLKYFTFCAVGALDVIMLDMEKVVRRSSEKRFDTVYFFDVDEEFIVETQKRIPGANGFAGDFVKSVLVDDPNEALHEEALEAPQAEPDTAITRQQQRFRQTKVDFLRSFPFDVVNLDLEQYLFKPNEELPGKVVNALRKVFAWQRNSQPLSGGKCVSIDAFTLMFTTQVGPKNLTDEYLTMLKTYVRDNLRENPQLQPFYDVRANGKTVDQLAAQDFGTFFTVAAPKALIALLLEADWQIDPKHGIEVFQFERPSKDGPYQMLHLVIDVKRINPPKDKRAPGHAVPEDAKIAYNNAALQIFEKAPADVSQLLTANERKDVETHLLKVKIHRDKVSQLK